MCSDNDPDSYGCYLEVYFKTAELAPSHVQLLMLYKGVTVWSHCKSLCTRD